MNKRTWVIAFIVCLILATLSPLASSLPDGLEKVAGDKGFLGLAGTSPVTIVADYIFPGIENEALATILAAWLGTIVVFVLAYGAAYLISRLKRRPVPT